MSAALGGRVLLGWCRRCTATRFLLPISTPLPYLSLSSSSSSSSSPSTSSNADSRHCSSSAASSSSSSAAAAAADLQEEPPIDAADVFRRWGRCTDSEASQILGRHPSIARIALASLQSKLQVLLQIGLYGSDLVKIINRRPRFLSRRIQPGPALDARLQFLRTLFPFHSSLLRAIVCNPSLLSYDLDSTIRPCVQLYEAMGVPRHDLGRLLISRPTVVVRSNLDDDKLDFLRRTGLRSDVPIYKHALSLVAISHLDTLRAKIANLERFGFTADEVMGLFARTPNVLSLSVEKVQRNMTFMLGSMKLPPQAALRQPAFLYSNLEKVLRPRYLLGVKLQEMGLEPHILGSNLIRAIAMKEPRFLRAFIKCHQEDISNTLMEFYTSLKELKRLAESSRAVTRRAIPY